MPQRTGNYTRGPRASTSEDNFPACEARPPRGMRASVLVGGPAAGFAVRASAGQESRTLHGLRRRTHKGPPRGGPDSCWSGCHLRATRFGGQGSRTLHVYCFGASILILSSGSIL